MNWKKLLRSKTVWAGIIAAATVLVEATAITPLVIVQAASIFLGAIGVRDAIAKNGAGR